jgi:1,2-diacylglycerol 3-alpha-glucosyltransferase
MLGGVEEVQTTPRCALIWSDIGTYHAARSKVAFEKTSFAVETVEVLGSAGFREFRTEDAAALSFPRHALTLSRPLRAAAVRRPLHDLLTRLRPDVVFTPGWSMVESLLTMEWCIAQGVRIVLMSESTWGDAPRVHAKEMIKRRVVGFAQAAFVGGTSQAEYVRELGMRRDLVFLGYDAVDNDHFARNAAGALAKASFLRAELGLPKNYFLICARLVEKKNIPRALEAFARYRACVSHSAWDLVIVGPGAWQSQIHGAVTAGGLSDAVHFMGAKGYSELPQYYGLAGALILPSVVDQWGLVVNEAMASGLPVLVSKRCGCARDLVQEGRNGFKFDPYDIVAMADAMRRVASDGCDRAAMGAASRTIIADWGPERFAAGFEAAARAALAAPKRSVSLADRLLLRALIR